MDRSPWNTFQKLLTALSALAVIFDGFDIQILAFAIPSLIREWHLARADFGPVLALGLAGMTLGGPLAGYLGDRRGRRPALIASVLLFGLATVATASVSGIYGLGALRFLTGLGAGGAVPNATALAAEFAPARRRSMAVKLTIVCIPLGGMLGGLIAAQVLPSLGWRWLYGIGGISPLLLAVLLWLTLPESPRFLARRPESRGQLAALLTRMGLAVPDGAVFHDATPQTIEIGVPAPGLFSPGFARDTTGLWVAFFFCLGSIYLVFGWMPAFLSAQGFAPASASTGLAVYNFGGVLGVLFLTGVLTMVGSRGPLLACALAAAASAFALLWAPLGPGSDVTLAIAAIGVNGFFANAVQTAMYALAAHVYPTAIRSSGVAWCAGVGRAGALISSLFGAYVIQAGHGAYWWTLAVAMLVTFAGLAWVRNHFPSGVSAEG